MVRLFTSLALAIALATPLSAATPPQGYGIGPGGSFGIDSLYSVDFGNGTCTLLSSGTVNTYTGLRWVPAVSRLQALDINGEIWEFPPTAQGWNNPVKLLGANSQNIRSLFGLNRCFGFAADSSLTWYCLGEDNTSTFLFKINGVDGSVTDQGKLSDNTNGYYSTLIGTYQDSLGGKHTYTSNSLGNFWQVALSN